MYEELLHDSSTIYLGEMIHREKNVQVEPTTSWFGFFFFVGKELEESPEMEEERCSLKANIMINVGCQPREFKFSSEASRMELDVDSASHRPTVVLLYICI